MKRIGRYEILRELGRGAMGIVFKARDPLIGRLVALKTITASVAEDPDLLERFRREAKTAGTLQHPNIVTVYEMGEAHGIPLIAMEYLEGESLEALISRGSPLSLAQKVGYVVQTCRALNHAHQHRVIHRDIKPGNIVVTADGVVKVVDFGIARLSDTSKTQTGTLLGTLSYMAPQQLRGKAADERSDIWAAGVVLYELLTYQRLFRGENQATVLLSILQDEPPPLRNRLPTCPPGLEAIAQRALRKDDGERYQSMEGLLLDLEPLWASFQQELVDELLSDSQRHFAGGQLLEARNTLRRTVQIDATNATAKTLLEKVNAKIATGGAALGVRRHTDKAEKLVAGGLYLEARRELEAALKTNPHDSVACRLLEEIPGEEEVNEDHAVVVSARAINDYAMQRTSALGKAQIAEGKAHPSVASRGGKGVVETRTLWSVNLEKTRASKGNRRPWRHYQAVYFLFGLIILAGVALETKKLATRYGARTAPATPTESRLPAIPPTSSLEDQQRRLIDLAHEAADASDYSTAMQKLDQAAQLNGPLGALILDLRHKFEVEQQDAGARDVARQERDLWTQGSNALAQNRLDQAEQAFKQILALPEGGRRRTEAQQQLDKVLPRRREEEQVFAQAQQLARKADTSSLQQAAKLFDSVIATNSPRHDEALRMQATVRDKLTATTSPSRTSQSAVDGFERVRFSQMEEQFHKAQESSDDSSRQLLRDLLPQFRSVADAGGPLSNSARNYADNLIPAALKDLDLRAAKASDAADAVRFNDATSHFRRAVDAHDAPALRSAVLPEFQAIAAAGGPRAAEANRYVSSLIPVAIQDATPWPVIGCPASALGLSPAIKPGDLVACGMLDAPKLKWVQFAWPEFPPRAKEAGRSSGLAMLSIAVDENGNVTDVRPRGVKDSYGFFEAAVLASRQWKTNPPRAQGKSVKTLFAVDVIFTP